MMAENPDCFPAGNGFPDPYPTARRRTDTPPDANARQAMSGLSSGLSQSMQATLPRDKTRLEALQDEMLLISGRLSMQNEEMKNLIRRAIGSEPCVPSDSPEPGAASLGVPSQTIGGCVTSLECIIEALKVMLCDTEALQMKIAHIL